jgi:hypothetical protein
VTKPVDTVRPMKTLQRLAASLVLLLVAFVSVPATAATPTPTLKLISCTTTRTSVTVHWLTGKTAAGKAITSYGIATEISQLPTPKYGRKARAGTVLGLTPRTAYRVQLVAFPITGDSTFPSCLIYTETLSRKKTTPMHYPLLVNATSTNTTISVTWSSGETATSALPSSYVVSVFPEDTNSAPSFTMPEPLSTHSATFTGLNPDTSYYIGLGSVDASGQTTVSSLIETKVTITTAPTTTAPTTTTTS